MPAQTSFSLVIGNGVEVTFLIQLLSLFGSLSHRAKRMLTQKGGFFSKAVTFCRIHLDSLETRAPGSSQNLLHTQRQHSLTNRDCSQNGFMDHGRHIPGFLCCVWTIGNLTQP